VILPFVSPLSKFVTARPSRLGDTIPVVWRENDRIEITPAAFDAKGERLSWLETAVVDRPAAMHGPG
jgi:hypothetical protein